jgi:hypothetical protein
MRAAEEVLKAPQYQLTACLHASERGMTIHHLHGDLQCCFLLIVLVPFSMSSQSFSQRLRYDVAWYFLQNGTQGRLAHGAAAISRKCWT